MGRLVTPISKEEYDKLPAWQKWMSHYWYAVIILFVVFIAIVILGSVFSKKLIEEPIIENPSIFILSSNEGDFDALLKKSNNFKVPTAFKFPEGVTFDSLLVRYDTRRPPRNIKGNAIEVMGGGRVTVYPSSYIPVIIPIDKLDKVKSILGKDVTPISH